jgi:hypothetical protein
MKIYGDPYASGVVAHALRLLNGGWPFGVTSEWLERLTPGVRKRVHATFTELFRAFVDQWIESGKNAEGREAPVSRNVYKITQGYAEPLSKVLLANKPEIDVLPSGEYAISLERGMVDDDALPESHAKEEAIYWFRALLNSPASFRIARCDNATCARYYGTYCGNCVGASSVKRMRLSRQARKQKLVNLAADFWDQWKPSRRRKQSDWVAAEMNKRLAIHERITSKWVSQNRTEIQTETERRNHG